VDGAARGFGSGSRRRRYRGRPDDGAGSPRSFIQAGYRVADHGGHVPRPRRNRPPRV